MQNDSSNTRIAKIDRKARGRLPGSAKLIDLAHIEYSRSIGSDGFHSTTFCDVLHYRSGDSESVSEVYLTPSSDGERMERTVATHRTPRDVGFRWRPLPPYAVDLARAMVLADEEGASFLRAHPRASRCYFLTANIFPGLQRQESPSLILLPKNGFVDAPVWMTAFVEPGSGISRYAVFDARDGALLCSFTALITDNARLNPSAFGAQLLLFGLFPKHLALGLLAIAFGLTLIALAMSAPAAGAAAALVTVWWIELGAAIAGALSGFVWLINCIIIELTAKATAATKGKIRQQQATIKAKLKAAQDASDNKNKKGVQDALDDAKKAQEEMKSTIDADTKMDGSEKADSQEAADKAAEQIQKFIETLPK